MSCMPKQHAKNKIMAPFMDVVMIANTCDDTSTDSCVEWLVESLGGSHVRLLLVSLFAMCMWLGVISCQLPTNNGGNMVIKSRDTTVVVDSKVDNFHIGWHANCNGYHMLWFMCVY